MEQLKRGESAYGIWRPSKYNPKKKSEPSAFRSSKSEKPTVKKGKGGSSKKMTEKEQSERFIESDQDLGEDFESAVSKILRN